MFSHGLPLLGSRSAIDIFPSSRATGEWCPESAAQPSDPADRSTAGSRPLITNVGRHVPEAIYGVDTS